MPHQNIMCCGREKKIVIVCKHRKSEGDKKKVSGGVTKIRFLGFCENSIGLLVIVCALHKMMRISE